MVRCAKIIRVTIILLFAFCMCSAYVFNIAKFISGGTPTDKGVMSSILFFAAWLVAGVLLKDSHGWIVFSLWMLSLSLIVAVACIIISIFDLTAAGMIMFVVLFLTPYYGFRIFDFLGDMHSVAIAFALELAYILLMIRLKQARK